MVVKTGIAFPDKVYEELNKIAKEMGYTSISKAVRDAVELFIAFNKWWLARGGVAGVILVMLPRSAEQGQRRLTTILSSADTVLGYSYTSLGDYALYIVVVAGQGPGVKKLYKELTRIEGVLAVQPSLLPLPLEETHKS